MFDEDDEEMKFGKQTKASKRALDQKGQDKKDL